MKDFLPIKFDLPQCRRELDQLRSHLSSKAELSERDDLQPLFKGSSQLSAFIGTCFPNIGPANRLAYEFDVFGDFTADIVIGNAERNVFCAIELEDARQNSIFNKLDGRATKEWGRRFEHGFGQLVDWFYYEPEGFRLRHADHNTKVLICAYSHSGVRAAGNANSE